MVNQLSKLALLAWAVCLCTGTGVLAQDRAIEPPAELSGILDHQGLTDAQAERRSASWADVRDTIEAENLGDLPEPAPASPLPDAARQLLDQSAAALSRGEAFRAVELLREADALAPGHVEVMRRLGVAYMRSGNSVRGASYLQRAFERNPRDIRALALLCRHSGQHGPLERAVAFCEAVKQAGYEPLGDYYLYEALSRYGYDTAAADRIAVALQAITTLDVAALERADDTDSEVLAELRVLAALRHDLRLRLGDLLLSLGRPDEAAEQYTMVTVDDLSDPGALVARQAYVSLNAGEPEAAVEAVLQLLASPDATQSHAELAGYIVSQGVGREQLAAR